MLFVVYEDKDAWDIHEQMVVGYKDYYQQQVA
jgi:hypothetical protein